MQRPEVCAALSLCCARCVALSTHLPHCPRPVVSPCSRESWVKMNFGQYGFYRVQYSANIWENLAQAAG